MRGPWFRPSRTPIKGWYERDGGARLSADRDVVAQAYPHLQFRVDGEMRRVSLEGNMVLLSESGIRHEIATVVRFPWTYPDSEPAAFDSGRRFKAWPGKTLADRHLGSDGHCCLWLPPCSEWNPADPLGLVRFLDQLAVFFDRQLLYDSGGTWPGPQYDHESLGYLEFIREQVGPDADALLPLLTMQVPVGRNHLCPCGKGQKYKHCHLAIVEDVQRQIGFDSIRKIFPANRYTPPAEGYRSL